MASGFAFADTDTTTGSKSGRGEMGQGRPGHERMTEEEREAHQEEREAKREERQAQKGRKASRNYRFSRYLCFGPS